MYINENSFLKKGKYIIVYIYIYISSYYLLYMYNIQLILISQPENQKFKVLLLVVLYIHNIQHIWIPRREKQVLISRPENQKF